MSKKPAKAAPALAPAMSPFDVEMTPEAQRHLATTISQITLDFLAKGLRHVGVPLGQANAIKTAFESQCGGPGAGRGRWRVEIAKVNGSLAELHFSTEGDPVVAVPASVLLPRIDELLAWSETPEVDHVELKINGVDTLLAKILSNLRALRAMVDG